MHLEINSIWQIESADGLPSGLYRLLQVYAEQSSVILFALEEGSKLNRPVSYCLPSFSELVTKNAVSHAMYERPYFQLVEESQIAPKHKIERDKRYALIKNLVENHYFLLDIVTAPKSKLISAHARELGTYVQKVYRMLNLYWRYGQDQNALLQFYPKCGRKGKLKSSGNIKRGIPVQQMYGNYDVSDGINISNEHRDLLLKGIKKYYLTNRYKTYKNVWSASLLQ